jgi:TfoX/Sxy family transcriptional regulator of competence genes
MPRESMKGKFLKPDEAMRGRLAAAAVDHDAVEKKMFGSYSWFTPVTAQMFICLWGADVAVRVGEGEAKALIKAGKVKPFEPVPGHTMKEYVFVPAADARDDRKLASWIERSAAYAMTLPPKKK